MKLLKNNSGEAAEKPRMIYRLKMISWRNDIFIRCLAGELAAFIRRYQPGSIERLR